MNSCERYRPSWANSSGVLPPAMIHKMESMVSQSAIDLRTSNNSQLICGTSLGWHLSRHSCLSTWAACFFPLRNRYSTSWSSWAMCAIGRWGQRSVWGTDGYRESDSRRKQNDDIINDKTLSVDSNLSLSMSLNMLASIHLVWHHFQEHQLLVTYYHLSSTCKVMPQSRPTCQACPDQFSNQLSNSSQG